MILLPIMIDMNMVEYGPNTWKIFKQGQHTDFTAGWFATVAN